MSDFYIPAPPEHIKKEKLKAKELRKTQWWKQQIGPGICYYCKQKFPSSELTMDHILPVARGGKSTKRNCVPACKNCNTEKGAKTLGEIALQKMKSER